MKLENYRVLSEVPKGAFIHSEEDVLSVKKSGENANANVKSIPVSRQFGRDKLNKSMKKEIKIWGLLSNDFNETKENNPPQQMR